MPPKRPMLTRQVAHVTDSFSGTSIDLVWLKRQPLEFKREIAAQIRFSNDTLVLLGLQ